MNISNEIRENAVRYSVDSIKHICETIGPRESGMPAELKAQEWMRDEMVNNGWVDTADLTPFQVARHGLLAFAPIIAVFLILGGLLQLVGLTQIKVAHIAVSAVLIVLSALSVVLLLVQFLFYRQFLDIFLPKTTSHNLQGMIKPTGEVKRRILFCGHADSAYEFTLMKIHQNVMVAACAIDFLLLFFGVIVAIINIVRGSIPLWFVIISVISSVIYSSLFFLFNFKTVVHGANDNLTGCLVSISVAKCLKESGIRLENTEVGVLITGSEEAGLRGAHAWSNKYKNIYNDVDTLIIALDTLRDYDWMTIYHRDMTGTVANSKRGVKLLDMVAEKMNHKLPHGVVPVGASDAAAISKNGMHAVCLAAQNPHGARYYHNRRDVCTDLDPKTIRLGLDIALTTVEIFDKEGLPEA